MLDDAREIVLGYIQGLRGVLGILPTHGVERTIEEIVDVVERGGYIYILGNGGSAATASHFACDLSKRFSIPVAALADNLSLITAIGNDVGYDAIFAIQLRSMIRKGDLVIGISASGQSVNVLQAMRTARDMGARTVGWTGFDGGQLKNLVDVCAIVPSDSVEHIEDAHLAMEHTTCIAIELCQLLNGSRW